MLQASDYLVTFYIYFTFIYLYFFYLRNGIAPSPQQKSAGWSLTLVSTVSNHPLAMDPLSCFLPTDFGHFIPEHSH